MNSFWLHPSLILIAGALLLPAVPARLKKGFLLLVPALLFARILTMAHGTFGEVHFQDWVLVFGRVDALSSVFGYIMSLMCILGTLYGLHVKETASISPPGFMWQARSARSMPAISFRCSCSGK